MIRKAVGNDLPEILKIYENARRFMAENGNPNQWGKTNPPQYTLERDIQLEQLYVVRVHGAVMPLMQRFIAWQAMVRVESWRRRWPLAGRKFSICGSIPMRITG